jgi:uncharacterized membrane protein
MGILSAGIFLLLPLVVIAIVLVKFYQLVIGPTQKLSAAFGIERLFMVQLFLVAIMILMAFIFGLLMKAKFIERIRDFLENNVLRFVPGYEFIKMRLMMTVGGDEKSEQRAVLVRIDDGWSPAFLIEEGPDGNCVVFVPDVPKSNSGSVYVVLPEQVKHLSIKFKELDLAVRNYGKGLIKITENLDLRVHS